MGHHGYKHGGYPPPNQPYPQAQGTPCPKCGSPNDASAKFCQQCGGNIRGTRKCPNCQKDVSSQGRFCSICGIEWDKGSQD